MIAAKPELPIHDMSARHDGLTPTIAAYFLEGARVCLDRHHVSPVDFSIEKESSETPTEVIWEATGEATRRAWANEIDTTEAGAYACALAALELADGLVAVHRSETRTGADYYVALPDTELDDLEGCLRFEVSGTDRGDHAIVGQRLRAKLEQAARGDSNLPAVAGVVGFAARLILIAELSAS